MLCSSGRRCRAAHGRAGQNATLHSAFLAPDSDRLLFAAATADATAHASLCSPFPLPRIATRLRKNPNSTQDSPPPSLPLPLLTSSPRLPCTTHAPSPTQANDTTHRCCPLPAARPLPAQVPTHTRLIAPASAFPPTPEHSVQLHGCGAQQGRRARLHTVAPSTQPARTPAGGPSRPFVRSFVRR